MEEDQICPFPQTYFLKISSSLSVIDLNFMSPIFSRSIRINREVLQGGKVGGEVIRSKKFQRWCEIGVGMANKATFTFSDNTAVLGPDFQTDIKFVTEWWNAFMIHYLCSNWIWSAPSSADNKGGGKNVSGFFKLQRYKCTHLHPGIAGETRFIKKK